MLKRTKVTIWSTIIMVAIAAVVAAVCVFVF